MMVVACFLVATTLGSATYLTYFAKIDTTMNVQQSVVIGDQRGWYNWDQPITRNLGDVVHCTDYTYKLLIWNRCCENVTYSFINTPTSWPGYPVLNGTCNPDGVTITHYVFGDTQTIRLVFKDANWKQVNPESYADVTFNTCGKTFNYTIVPHNLQGAYSLIYYFDKDPRFVDYGHCLVLGNVNFDGSSTPISGLADVQTMPYQNDSNAKLPADYTVSDGYVHARGAKLWLVPQSSLTSPAVGQENRLIGWDQALYLFETDLFLYIDCDNWLPYCLPDVFPLFNTNILRAHSVYCWITCYHVDLNIMPGIYSFETKLTEVGAQSQT